MSIYSLKLISFNHRNIKILCQNENGPCPLLSLFNSLLLLGYVHISLHYDHITLETVTQIIADYILQHNNSNNNSNLSNNNNNNNNTSNNNNNNNTSNNNNNNSNNNNLIHNSNNVRLINYSLNDYKNDEKEDEMQLYKQRRVAEAINILPSLQFGLDVNIYFDNVSHFEYTRELDCFDAVGVPLYHGWILDSQDSITFPVVGSLSYNQLMNILVEFRSLKEILSSQLENIGGTDGNEVKGESKEALILSLSSEKQKLLQQGEVIETFLIDTASQFTYTGLLSLYEVVPEGSLCTFFRNNHFSTLHKRDKKLYLLVTDQGYANESQVVWELLDEINGNTEYVDSNFRPVVNPPSTPTITPISVDRSPHQIISQPHSSHQVSTVDEDFLLALEISKLEYTGNSNSTSLTTNQQYLSGSSDSQGIIGYARPPSNQQSTKALPPPEYHHNHNHNHNHHISSPEIPFTPSYSLTAEQEEYDRLKALALQEEYNRIQDDIQSHPQYYENDVDATTLLKESIPPDQLEAYMRAEKKYLSKLNNQSSSTIPCIIQ